MKRIFKQNEIYIFFILIILCVVITSFNRSFFSLATLFDLLRGHSYEGILAIGLFIALLSGGIDVSFTAVAITGAYLGNLLLVTTGIDSLALGLIVTMSIGIILGAINGFFIGFFKIPTLIVTLGTLTAFWGALTTYLQTFVGKTIIPQLSPSVVQFGKTNIFTITVEGERELGFPLSGVIFIGLAVLAWAFLKYTTLGRSIKGLGGNIDAAKRIGFKVTLIQIFIYSFIGWLASIAGFLNVAHLRIANPLYLIGTEITIIAAVVIGGASINGGKGSIIGTILGVSLLVVIKNSLVLMRIPSYFQQFVIGALIVISVSITAYREQRKAIATRVLDVS